MPELRNKESGLSGIPHPDLPTPSRINLRHIIPISGKDSAATALVQLVRAPDLPYEFIFCDVEMELPETYAWLTDVEKTLGITIKRVGESLEKIIVEKNMLPSHGTRFCTQLGKIFPIRDFIGSDYAVQYVGIRADEDGRVAKHHGPENIISKYPLIEMGLGIQHVYQILEHRGIVPPSFFWQKLYNAVIYGIDSSARNIVENLKPWTKAMLFSWRSRSNCFNCFYQRRYEWVGLLEHHPELFARAEQLENDYGTGDRRPHDIQFSWIEGLPLPELRTRAGAIFAKRVTAVKEIILTIQQGDKFKEEFDLMTTTSCGLYCGK